MFRKTTTITMTMSEYILYKSVSLTANVKLYHKSVFNTTQTSNDEIINVYFNIYIYHICISHIYIYHKFLLVEFKNNSRWYIY